MIFQINFRAAEGVAGLRMVSPLKRGNLQAITIIITMAATMSMSTAHHGSLSAAVSVLAALTVTVSVAVLRA